MIRNYYYGHPSKEFNEFVEEWKKVEEKKKPIDEVCKEFVDKHVKIDWDGFLFELNDNNYMIASIWMEQAIVNKLEEIKNRMENSLSDAGVLDDDRPDRIADDEELSELDEQIEYLEKRKVPPLTEEEKKEYLQDCKVEWGGDRHGDFPQYGDTRIYIYKVPAGPLYKECLNAIFEDFSTGFSKDPRDIVEEYKQEVIDAGYSENTGVKIAICQNGIAKLYPLEKEPPVAQK